MKNIKRLFTTFLLSVVLAASNYAVAQDFSFTAKENPIIRHKLTADPSALVYNGKLYLYTGQDEAPNPYKGNDPQNWLVFSSDDLTTWTEYPVAMKRADYTWTKDGEKAWASRVIEKGGKFYMYSIIGNYVTGIHRMAVAVADSPIGPFKDAKMGPIITEQGTGDPNPFIDDNGDAYLFWGSGQCFYSKLKDNMTELEGTTTLLDLPGYNASSWVHKHNGWYYLSYAYGYPNKIAYAMSRSIKGPWEYKGLLCELSGNSVTNHQSIIKFNDEWYFFYHNGALTTVGGVFARSVCVDRLYYNKDGTIKRIQMTTEGIYGK